MLDEVAFSGVARSADWIRLSFLTQKPGQQAVQVPPSPLTGIAGATNPQGGISLSWNPLSGGVDNIVVEKQVGNGQWEQVAVLMPNATGYTDNTAGCGEVIRYRLAARFGDALSEYSTLQVETNACGFLMRNVKVNYPTMPYSASNSIRMKGIRIPYVYGSTSNQEFILKLR
jgi:hypothetical protein